MKTMLSLIVALQAASVFAAKNVKWMNYAVNTPDTAYDWNTPGNWQNEIVGGDNDYVNIWIYSEGVYIRLDSNVAPRFMNHSSTAHAFLLGDITLSENAGGATSDDKRAYILGGYFYGDVTFPAGLTVDQYIGGSVKFCGRILHRAGSGKRAIMPSGAINFCYNRFAREAGEQRTEDVGDQGYVAAGNGTLTIYAPEGAEAATGRWRLTAGSPYAYRVSSTAHGLAVGTTVTAADDGVLSSGTFLKHVFTDSTIELSSPALASGEADLSFAAFTPDFTAQFVNAFRVQGANVTFKSIKKRNEDNARVVFNELYCSYNKALVTMGQEDGDTSIPGTFVIKKITGTWSENTMALKDCVMELAGDGSSTTLGFDTDHPVSLPVTKLTSRLVVPAGISASIAKLHNWKGTLAKEGTGSLSVNLQSLTNGSVAVRGGSFSMALNAGIEGEMQMNDITLEDGAVFTVPASGVHVKTLSIGGNVTISGGKIMVAAGADRSAVDITNVTFTDGAGVVFALAGGAEADSMISSLPSGEVVGHPAFWVDASKPETIVYTTENDVNYVTRWNDCREGEPMFCTNIVKRPTLMCGEKMSEKYVKIAKYTSATNYNDTELLVWSKPIEDIKAVFLVQDPSDGGGTILGRCSWRLPNDLYNTWGGPFYRSDYTKLSITIVSDSNSTIPAVRYGRYYLNGQDVVGRNSFYLGSFMQLLEFHANTSYARSTGQVTCDAFGGGYYNNQAQVKQSNGGMRIAEYIIYTNTLSHVERLRVAQYLSRKWLGHDILYTPVDLAYTHEAETNIRKDGVELDVSAGQVAAIKQVAGGSFAKTGGGRLYVKGLDGASLRVEDGSVTLLANTLRRYVPNDTWIHLDAQAADSLVTTSGDVLDKWYDVNGTGASFRNDNFTGKAKVVQNAIGNHPVVDIGPVNNSSQSAGLVYYDTNGVVSADYTLLPQYMNEPFIRTAFAVYNSSAGGGAIFGGRGNGWPSKGFPHRHSKGDDSPIIDETTYVPQASHGLPAVSNAIAKGTAVFRRNGVDIDPFTATFLKDDERVAYAHSEGRKIASLGTCGQSGESRGGLKYGEVIMFERRLTNDEITDVDAYLAKRWFGIDTPGYGSDAATVTVAQGASLTVQGTDFSATTLGGGGTITGDVELASGGTLLAVVSSDGSVQTLSVTGTAKVNGGTVTLAGDVGAIKPGSYAILHADTLQNGGGQWIAPSKTSRNIFIVTVTADSIYLNVLEKGLRITFR